MRRRGSTSSASGTATGTPCSSERPAPETRAGVTLDRLLQLAPGKEGSMNALTLLKQDHGNVEELFHRFETAKPDDVEELARVRDLVIEHLSRHAVVEEQVFYPAIRTKLGDENSFTVLEGLEEHHAAKAMLSELEKLAPTHERFRAKFTVIIE